MRTPLVITRAQPWPKAEPREGDNQGRKFCVFVTILYSFFVILCVLCDADADGTRIGDRALSSQAQLGILVTPRAMLHGAEAIVLNKSDIHQSLQPPCDGFNVRFAISQSRTNHSSKFRLRLPSRRE